MRSAEQEERTGRCGQGGGGRGGGGGVIGPDRCGAAVRGALRWLRPRPAAAASAGAQTRPGPDWGVSPEGG